MNYSLRETDLKGKESTREYNDYTTLNSIFNSYLKRDLTDIKNISIIDNKTDSALSVMTMCYGSNHIFSVGDIIKLRSNDDVAFILRRFDCKENCAYLERIDENGNGTGKIACFGLESLVVKKQAKRK